MRRCPRCEEQSFEPGRGGLSRTTRDEGAPIEVCSRCSSREALYGYDPAAQVSFTEWPLTREQIAEEDRRLRMAERGDDDREEGHDDA